ncbi:malto-oligosyltrehalose trehalohydrolase [Schlesneria paludicola]|uniref:malto-oligosyltrehalose trehalohydrolase n=1 Tax=Schlesneria paludicola TaxID=360056 RepID=UPI00029A525D|nr:malto-oligosyltrehalose trehalohydrolase [Schlesneria paludicola]
MDGRRYPIGAEPQSNGVHFRVWAPNCQQCAVVIEGVDHDLTPEPNGYFAGLVHPAEAGTIYQFRLDQKQLVPDPASRFQPEGPHGPSQVIDGGRYRWSDAGWKGRTLHGLVLYEMHIGTFTAEGTWAAAAAELAELASLGINCVEIMPIADFAGTFGWGYDGVNLFAPTRLYGVPDDARRFVDTAHAHGISVILDVVYNHLGPDGNYLALFASDYFTDRYATDWGAALNFDGPNADAVRDFFRLNAAYWIDEFHLDGLRLDATQNIYDSAPIHGHIITQIAQAARAAAPERTILLIAENEPQDPALCRDVSAGGYGLDAVWNDDFHHSAMVSITGHREAYYQDYLGQPQEFITAAKYGYLYQGQWYGWQEQRRGQPGLDLPAPAFINFIQNHDQIANSCRGKRVHQQCSPARFRAMTALALLLPGTPMLFQGQEFAASSPFFYFADHHAELAAMIEEGRIKFLSQFPSLADREIMAQIASPHDATTFRRCKLDFSERVSHCAEYQLTKDLLKLRQTPPGFQPLNARHVDGAVLGDRAFAIRYFFENGQDRLLVVNLGLDLKLTTVPEPLLAPPIQRQWSVMLSTDDSSYGGNGVRPPEEASGGWFLTGESAVVLEGLDREHQPKEREHPS